MTTQRADVPTSSTKAVVPAIDDALKATLDRIAEQQSLGTETSTTRSRYDPLDRTIERTEDAGTAEAGTASYEYLGTSGDVAAELVDGTLDRTYQYGPLLREAAEPGPFHSFPGSFDEVIYNQGTRSVVRDFFNKARPLMSNDSVQYRLPGVINNRPGVFEIFTRPSVSGRTEAVQHRFFRPGHR